MTTNRTKKVQTMVGRNLDAKVLADNSRIGKDERAAPYSRAEQMEPA